MGYEYARGPERQARQAFDKQDRCWFNGKCADEEVFDCWGEGVDCKFNRRIRDNWYCVHHRNDYLCNKVHNNIITRRLTEKDDDRDLDTSTLEDLNVRLDRPIDKQD